MKILIATIASIVIGCLTYLTASFANADFNISNWDGFDRGFIAFMGLFFIIIAFFATYGYLTRNDD